MLSGLRSVSLELSTAGSTGFRTLFHHWQKHESPTNFSEGNNGNHGI